MTTSTKGHEVQPVHNLLRHVARTFRRILANSSNRSRPLPTWQTVRDGPCKGLRLFVSQSFDDMVTGTYDRYIFDALERIHCVFDGKVCWDVGAHVGYHSLAFATLAGPAGRVVSFEPNPANRDRMGVHLEANPELRDRIHILPYALSNTDGEQGFTFSNDVDEWGSSCSHLNSEREPGDRVDYRGFNAMQVMTRRGDTLLTKNSTPGPTIMKIDVEGAELQVLQGAEQLIKQHRPCLALEVHNIHAMYHVHTWLSRAHYHIELVADAPYSHSRCFLIAFP